MQTSIVIIVAMESEQQHLESLLPGWDSVSHPVWPTVRNGDVVCITCGIGMVAAAAATQHAIHEFSPKIIMNYGCTGAHSAELYPGDVVIGERLVNQGKMRFAPDGEIVLRVDGFNVEGEVDSFKGASTDQTLRVLAEKAARELELPAWPIALRAPSQPDRAPIVRTGTVSSGDIWIQVEDMIHDRHQRFGSLCEDMEAASIGQICAMHGVPFLTVKDISNSELHEKTQFDESTWVHHSVELGLRAAMVIVDVIQRLQKVDMAPRMRYS